MFLLGIDIGTSGTKTVLFDEQGNSLASKTVEYPLYQPNNGWAEQDPLDWWNASVEGIKYVLNEVPKAKTDKVAIGLSGQMHGLVMLDKNGEVIRKSIIWCDQRTVAECEQMKQKVGEKRLIEISANPAMTGFTASKILWVQNNEPENYAKCVHILLPKDYIRFMLTGDFATEVSDASGMQLMDVAKRTWSKELLTAFDIDSSLLGKMYESPEITGEITGNVAKLTGLPLGTRVSAGAGDNAAGAIGTGICREGYAFNTIGTSAVVYAVSDKLSLDLKGRVHSLCASVPGKWTVMSCTQSAGLSLKWLRDTVCQNEIIEAEKQGIDPYILMDKMAEKVPVGSDNLLFLPYLMGERSPHPDPNCRGTFFGLSARHEKGNLIRAVLEGVAFSQKECIDVFNEMGVNVDTITLCGGGSKSPLWKRIFSDVYGVDINTLQVDQGGALGAALLAGVGCGVYSSVEDACDNVVKYKPAISPSEKSKEYVKFYELYKSLYPALKDSFDKLAEM